MTTSEQVNEIATALAKAQAGMKNAALNKVNPHFKSKYADLAGIRDTVIPPLTANGIAVVQTLDAGMGGVSFVLTRLLHTSGQWIEGCCPIPAAPDMQKMGSAITYARRYSLSAICGIAADEDDDGNAAATVPVNDGYGEWLADMEAVADEGFDRLVAAVKQSKPAYRDRLKQDAKAWNALKVKAEKAQVAA
jgi:hypothetical protein